MTIDAEPRDDLAGLLSEIEQRVVVEAVPVLPFAQDRDGERQSNARYDPDRSVGHEHDEELQAAASVAAVPPHHHGATVLDVGANSDVGLGTSQRDLRLIARRD